MKGLRVWLKEFNEFAESVYEIDFEDKVVRIEHGDYFKFDEVEFYLGETKIEELKSKSKKYDELCDSSDIDLVVEFDELGMSPTTLVPDVKECEDNFRHRILCLIKENQELKIKYDDLCTEANQNAVNYDLNRQYKNKIISDLRKENQILSERLDGILSGKVDVVKELEEKYTRDVNSLQEHISYVEGKIKLLETSVEAFEQENQILIDGVKAIIMITNLEILEKKGNLDAILPFNEPKEYWLNEYYLKVKFYQDKVAFNKKISPDIHNKIKAMIEVIKDE